MAKAHGTLRQCHRRRGKFGQDHMLTLHELFKEGELRRLEKVKTDIKNKRINQRKKRKYFK